MDKQELQIIQELMEVLQDKMQYGEDDLSERLGRKKPDVEVVKVESELPLEGATEESGLPMGDGMDEDPDESLKRRLMSMRG